MEPSTFYSRVVIVSGGSLGSWALDLLREDDYIIGADAGALFLVRQGIKPHLSLGDFDSVSREERNDIQAGSRELASFDPVDKNYTDTELAFRRGLELKPSSLLLLGATGSRLDHTMANVHLLRTAAEKGVSASIEDAANRVRVLPPGSALDVLGSRFEHISLLPLSLRVTGIRLIGFQYPLTDATLDLGQSLGISNALAAEAGTVSTADGWLLVMESIG
ncbi:MULTISPECIES: thiamine diphosphokinase [unclassified Paenibacillus]|uniref:thiamine diphosphokinase n=1 Tax=unclassified Paenibacillus TaxID=185978 RepID=UPI00095544DD|nr:MULTISPECIES: thiamine diphosphokinase [unclassified Paenibacillus]SIQ40863.1 thiamine pyrophosphokinase [Paenibacillus sp. RU4X]SIQ63041.1 thiamine pyrophosphokinase [Paenibacillus sp. RU4T]